MHAIRLKDYWTATECGPGRVRYSRHFGAPRHSESETVWLVGTAAGEGQLLINGDMVAEFAAGRFEVEITSTLKPRNEVVIEAAAMPGDVAVEIR